MAGGVSQRIQLLGQEHALAAAAAAAACLLAACADAAAAAALLTELLLPLLMSHHSPKISYRAGIKKSALRPSPVPQLPHLPCHPLLPPPTLRSSNSPLPTLHSQVPQPTQPPSTSTLLSRTHKQHQFLHHARHIFSRPTNATRTLTHPSADLLPSRIPEIDARSIDALTFLRNHVATNTPVIIRGAAASWPATAKWNSAYLSQAMGAAAVKVNVTPDGRAGVQFIPKTEPCTCDY
jgi:hypothetical protein